MSDMGKERGAPGKGDPVALPSLEEVQHWTGVIGQAQQMLMEHVAEVMARAPGDLPLPSPIFADPEKLADQQSELMKASLGLFGQLIEEGAGVEAARDRRFKATQWRETPIFGVIADAYLLLCDAWLKGIDALEGLPPRQREQLKFATRVIADAMSPSNFALTNPLVLERIFETRGENLLRGLDHMLADIGRGKLTHSDTEAFELGRNIAATPGKVIHETPLYQLIHYAPVTESVVEVPLLIFPPWINRFYILDLNPKNSFIRWAVAQGFSVFVVSWKSADESMANVTMDDYVVRGQVDAIDTVRALLGVEHVHAIGYCVAGTALSMALAYLAAKGEAAKVRSATFFTTQVDFSDAGDLNLFVDDEQLKLIDALTQGSGVLDGRFMAATFNLLRGRDLIWHYVVQNYLLGEDYPAFDLLHWNGDTTNLPGKWHRAYLEDFYRDNRLVQAGALSIDGVPVDLTLIETPAYVQAGREDHIAPSTSVWKMTGQLSGPVRFVLAGSGHIAGVVNPPEAGKYQYWTCEKPVETLEAFQAAAKETKGSWWPDWRDWVRALAPTEVPVAGARVPGEGALPAIEEAPGRYVRTP
ncbi:MULTISPECIES: PHA/PHB synthase family protein [unclassified Sphingomonas]|uniref:PHA/PHB synthase family protein n=1 Tax=unclassified Sphingomonas TaxID=196159 RepID=UPI0006F3D49D|nr:MULTISPECIES: class I poly(R)-hydroxyalkanoic acid synthase [unclassified Sphingomonas]KQX25944.1 poly(R)-hydroxyalkanoic acid synthase [Sphingomonas sp. Root1294]KQY69009.1 poly(R)-hydroxyalkanoic acid synthase [Sphingomonas sp. Root50]KRB89265.1 poly(R)-hydroxyalkanoic acid synthase [Sphingomonas sp. Root720]